MMDQDLIDLISVWRGGELESQRGDQLIARLREDEAFLQSFVDEVRMLGMLKAVQSMEPRWLALQDELGWGSGRVVGVSEEIGEDDASWLTGTPSIRRNHRVRWARIAAAVIAVGLLTLTWSRIRWTGEEGADRSIADSRSSGLAILVKLDGVEWGPPDGRTYSEGALLAPGPFRFRSGQAMLFFLNGVTLTLEGPADVDLVSVDRIFCRRGKLRARVPEGAEGFVVASSESAVVDMGTEFALNVDPDGKSRVMVFEGAAEAMLLDAKGAPNKTQVVEWNKEFELDPAAGKIAPTLPRPEGFVAKPGLPTPSLALDPGYREAVMESRPKGYWRFESESERSVPNEVAGGPPLQINGPVALTGGSSGNGCAVFKPKAPEQFLTADSLWELPRRPGHAVEFWFMSEGINYASLVGLFPMAETYSLAYSRPYVHAFIVESTANEPHSPNRSASIRFLRRWPLQADLGTSLFSRNIYTPRRWHHIVAQQDGDRMDLYVDGVKDSRATSEPMHPNLFCRLVVGRRTTNPRDPKDSRPFVGRFDELAIYDHPLSEDEIRRHHELGHSEQSGQSPNSPTTSDLHR